MALTPPPPPPRRSLSAASVRTDYTLDTSTSSAASPPPRITRANTSSSTRASPDMSMHHRPPPTLRSSSASLAPSVVSSRAPTPRHSPLIPASPLNGYPADNKYDPSIREQQQQQLAQPTICGLPLKYVSLVTLAVQNAALSIVMHYSRVSIPPSLAYSPASAVLLNELLKGSISFVVALSRSPVLEQQQQHYQPLTRRKPTSLPLLWLAALSDLCGEIFSPDCWKLSIPAILYVVQNSLQFVAISNLPVASFQVTYQMKILTTAAFSVAMLRKRLSSVKWLSLFFLAIGVGIVQIQNAASTGTGTGSGHAGLVNKASATAVGSAHEFHVHVMNPLKGFGAVTAACFTSGLAGVYFEMVLKGSKADLWVRNVQLSLFSLIPALLPILYAHPPPNSRGFILDIFHNFGWWAWATVAIQVAGGLVTAVVIKYSDNILKGFATSLSIVLSFLASVALFDFRITPSFIIGASTVLGATWMYNQPAVPAGGAGPGAGDRDKLPVPASAPASPKEKMFSIVLNESSPPSSGKSSPSPSPYYPGTPVGAGGDASANANGVLGGLGVGSFMRRKSGGFGGAGSSRNSSTASLTALFSAGAGSPTGGAGGFGPGGKGELGLAESGELLTPLESRASGELGLGGVGGGTSPFSSRSPSRMPSRAPSPVPRRTTSSASVQNQIHMTS